MADYIASARSNYFKVKDPKKFQDFCDRWSLSNYGPKGKFYYGFGVEDDCHGNLQTTLWDDEGKVIGDLFPELAAQLKKGEVAIVMECGAEKLRYVCGWAVAVNANGKCVQVGTNDIYKKAKQLLPVKKRSRDNAITLCEY